MYSVHFQSIQYFSFLLNLQQLSKLQKILSFMSGKELVVASKQKPFDSLMAYYLIAKLQSAAIIKALTMEWIAIDIKTNLVLKDDTIIKELVGFEMKIIANANCLIDFHYSSMRNQFLSEKYIDDYSLSQYKCLLLDENLNNLNSIHFCLLSS